VNLVLFLFRVLAARNAKAVKAMQPRIDAINARYKGGSCERRSGALSGVYVIAGIGGSQRLGSIC
jgi:membrane protein insertase Oxa1/YidC/SpoIIIJ